MKSSEKGAFDVPELSIGSIPEGTSILLTGDDTAAIEAVFYHLVSAREDERSLVLATETNGRTVNRGLDRVEYGASNRSTVLTCSGAGTESNVTTVDDIGDLTGVGMQFSALVTESGTMAASQRAGILLCSSICRAVDDIQSVFRFLNANFLTHLRRDGIMGICAVDTSAPIGGSIDGMIDSMAAAFSAHIAVETTDTNELRLHLSGFDAEPERVTVTLPE
mgnify:CR=1 FL=1